MRDNDIEVVQAARVIVEEMEWVVAKLAALGEYDPYREFLMAKFESLVRRYDDVIDSSRDPLR